MAFVARPADAAGAPVTSAALEAVRSSAGALGIVDPADRRVDLVAEPPFVHRDVAVVRVGLQIDGVPLDRPVAAVLATRAGDVRRVVAQVAGAALVPMGPAVPTLTPADALARLAASGEPASAGARRADLVWMVRPGGLRLAYRIDPPADRRTGANFVYGVDARTGEVFVRARRDALANVRAFEFNPVATPAAEIHPLVDVDDQAPFLQGAYLRATNCLPPQGSGDCVPTPTAEPDANGDFLYPAPNVNDWVQATDPTDTFAEVSIYYHADKLRAWLDGLGFSGLACNEGGGLATLVANFGSYENGEHVPYDNAFWSGDCDFTMVFGQTNGADLSYDGDVVYHEFGHGVVEAETPGETLFMPRPRIDARVNDAGAMNEAFADFLSSAFTGDPLVGEYAGEYWLGTSAVRNNDNDFSCPVDLTG
ncbi:MAG: hypothetical protein D6705_10875, partial [Deltaproteobacteria bacterium]